MEEDTKGRTRYKIKPKDRCSKNYAKLVKRNPALEKKVDRLLAKLAAGEICGDILHARLKGMRSYHFKMPKVKNQYRIVYELDKKASILYVHEISPRSQAYTRLERHAEEFDPGRDRK
ncbi:MAG: hypothetical protein D9C04_05595 [Nitrosopumilus sp. B06]|nr:MAG: hypothetical protein D9C04_05595 [Nitrosopumilus sp. B06]